MQFGERHQGHLTHAPIDVYAENLEVDTTIGLATTACWAMAAMKVWLNGATHAWCQAALLRTYRDDLDAHFVAQDTRIREEGLFTAKGMKIRSAHAHLANAHQRFSRPRCARFIYLRGQPATRSLQYYRSHHYHFPFPS